MGHSEVGPCDREITRGMLLECPGDFLSLCFLVTLVQASSLPNPSKRGPAIHIPNSVMSPNPHQHHIVSWRQFLFCLLSSFSCATFYSSKILNFAWLNLLFCFFVFALFFLFIHVDLSFRSWLSCQQPAFVGTAGICTQDMWPLPLELCCHVQGDCILVWSREVICRMLPLQREQFHFGIHSVYWWGCELELKEPVTS